MSSDVFESQDCGMMRKMSQFQSRRIVVGIILLISFIGAGVMYFTTRLGPWAYSDAVGYIVNARNLLRGDGIGLWRASGRFVLTSHHPPFYILSLASLGVFGVDPLVTARGLSVFMFALTILVIGLSVYSITKNGLLAISLSGVTLSLPILIELYSGAMSEGLFILLGFSALMTTVRSVQKGDMKYVLASGILSGLAFLTRYIGVGFVITVALVPFLFTPQPLKSRIRHATLTATIGILPVAIWLIWLRFQPATEPARLINFTAGNLWTTLEPVRVALVDSFIRALPFISNLPHYSYRLNLLIFLGIFLLISSYLFFPWVRVQNRRIQKEGTSLLALTLILFVGVYILTLILSFLLTQPTPDVNLRTLSPAIFAFTLAIVVFAFYLASLHQQSQWLIILPLLFAASIVVFNYPIARSNVLSLHQYGKGYTSAAWQSSPTIEAVLGMHPEIPIITNESVGLLLYTDRYAYDLPQVYSFHIDENNARFGDDSSDPTAAIFREGGAALVLFNSIFQQLEPVFHDRTKNEVETLIDGLDVVFESTDGAIYFYPGK